VKKLIIPVAIVAIGAGAYLYQQQESAYNVLSYVPSDTPLFTGQLTPFPIKDYVASAPKLITPSDQARLDALYEKDIPSLAFAANLLKAYQDGLKDADLLVKTFGLADEIRAYAYTLGLLPVLKVEVANPQAIWDLLDKNEQETGFVHKEGKIKDLSYRIYTITPADADEVVDVIVAQANGILTITVKTKLVSDTLLATALGLDKPKESLADTNTLSDIIKQHQFSDASVGFINNLEIIKGLTSTDGNQLARQLAKISTAENDNPFEMLQTPICQQELTSIAQNWPRTAFGYTTMKISKEESTIGFAAVIESKNQVILDALKTMRGYIPSYTQNFDNNVVATSIGLDISQLSSSLTKIWGDLQKPTYQCEPLAQIQSEISASGQSLAMIGMSANMASGVKGISAAIFDYTMDANGEQPKLDTFDALLAVHADNPAAIFNSIKMFSPGLQQVRLIDNGPAISLKNIFPIPAQLNIDPKLALKGSHLVIYNGTKGLQEAEKLALEELSANGLYQLSFDFNKMLTPIASATQFMAADSVAQEMQLLMDYDARMNINLDINEQGIRFDSTVNNKSSNKQ
tara:strand:+ start:3728 stop:5452 length:1725 start_codon:yes stop_codon:yes gene_type:complete